MLRALRIARLTADFRTAGAVTAAIVFAVFSVANYFDNDQGKQRRDDDAGQNRAPIFHQPSDHSFLSAALRRKARTGRNNINKNPPKTRMAAAVPNPKPLPENSAPNW